MQGYESLWMPITRQSDWIEGSDGFGKVRTRYHMIRRYAP